MGFLRRLLSPEYRHALAAEAEGDYLTAARSYALCGERGKVTDMHLAQARNEQTIEGRIRCLRNARAFAPEDDDDQRRPMVLRLLARALQEHGDSQGVGSDRGRRALLEAARLLEESEAWAGAGDLYLQLGLRQEAAAAYSRGGLIDRVEEVLAEQEAETARGRRVDSGFASYELLLQEGRRDEARASLVDCIEAAALKGEYRRLLDELENKLLSRGTVDLEFGARRLLIVGELPLEIGRDPDCELVARGPSVSRRHARLVYQPDAAGPARFAIEDLDSRNGTLLNGLPIAGTVALPGRATIGLGESCEIGVETAALADRDDAVALIRLEVRRGVDRHRRLIASPFPVPLAPEGGPPVTIEFVDRRPWLRRAVDAPASMRLNGAQVAGPVQLIRGDRVLVASTELRVRE